MSRVFDHFNQVGPPCRICGTLDDKPTVLVPIPGTQRDRICEAEQVHLACCIEATSRVLVAQDAARDWDDNPDTDPELII